MESHLKPLTATRSLFIEAPSESIWTIHADIARWSRWQSGISSTEVVEPLGIGSRFGWKSGGLTISSTIRVWEPDRKMSWTGTALGTRANHSWLLEPQMGGTLVTAEESMEGWLVNVLRCLTPSFLDRSLDLWLRNLRFAAETRERLN